MPHAPFLISYWIDFLPPFAMYKAFPCSDYYGGSVAMPDFQRHFSWLPLRFITLRHYA